MTTRVEESELEIDPVPLAAGGTADILRCSWGGGVGLYKRYKSEYLPKVDDAALSRLVQWRTELSRDVRQQLDDLCAWPVAVVYRRGRLVGVLMPSTPAGLTVGSADRTRQRARTLSDLRRLDPDLPPGEALSATPEALAAFGLTAQAILWLHRYGVVVNDVQPLNVLVNSEYGRVYLVDCDAMKGPWGVVGPPAAPSYFNELITNPPSPAVDLAKLAWCVFFVLLEDFSLRGLGSDVQQQALCYLPKHTVDLLVRTAMLKEDVARLSVPWAERASQWISCGRSGVLVTDDGWRSVTVEQPVARPSVQSGLSPTVPLSGAGWATVRAPTVPAPTTEWSRPPAPFPAGRSRTARRVWALTVATVVALVIVFAVLDGRNFIY